MRLVRSRHLFLGMASLLAKEHAHCTRARSGLRHARKQKKRETFVSLFQYPEEYLFSNQFMEDLERIYRLRKYFPSFEEPSKSLVSP